MSLLGKEGKYLWEKVLHLFFNNSTAESSESCLCTQSQLDRLKTEKDHLTHYAQGT